MSDIINRFRENLQLSGYAGRSIQAYVRTVLQFVRFCQKPPEAITEEDLRQYWLCCENDFAWSPATLRISYSGIRHFFSKTLIRSWPLLNQVHFKRAETLPTVLSCEEVNVILRNLPTLQSQAFYLTLYSLGLRLLEALTLQVQDILSQRGMVHVRAGKGAKDRLVPLPPVTLQALRTYYRTHRNPQWIFPAMGRNGGKDSASARTHASANGVQGALKRTVKRLGIKKHVHPHVFRHSYATHLIEANVPIKHVQELLGHKTLKSTLVYLHVTTRAQKHSHQQVIRILQGVLS